MPESTAAPNGISPPQHHGHWIRILAGSIGGALFLVILIIGVYLCKSDKVATVKPWATGLSGQLQKAFVTGNSSSQ